ncbi:hypothetical protein [Cryobacterium sp. GrIS_2_6]|uniref:hypothetical protein n=1 Tax=Cryobacterium sp. GrIS_2_6 TaxID=3162785 RepID=UPI002E024A1A|nr:hypothetical protein [Cryobacterium psychrotolerans]
MSQDKELDAIANIIRDQLAPLPYKNMFPEKQEQVREIQQLIATLIREARLDELNAVFVSYDDVASSELAIPVDWEYGTVADRITQLTNQQKGL